MAVTARITILLDESQKLALIKQARAAKVSLSEFIRNKTFDADDDAMTALLALVKQSTKRASAALDEALDVAEKNTAEAAKREAVIRSRAEKEFVGIDFAAVVKIKTPHPHD